MQPACSRNLWARPRRKPEEEAWAASPCHQFLPKIVKKKDDAESQRVKFASKVSCNLSNSLLCSVNDFLPREWSLRPESASVELLQTGEIFALWSSVCGRARKLKEEEVFCHIRATYLIRKTNQLNKRKSTDPEGKGRNTKRGPKSKAETTPKSERKEKFTCPNPNPKPRS